MVRRLRRIGRRRSRRLRRFRRARRSYGRWRFRRFRRYRGRRRYGRRRRFYSRKGQKTAVAYLMPSGIKKRTYRFWFSRKMLQDFDGRWRSAKETVQANNSWSIMWGKTYTYQQAGSINNNIHIWTGPGCMYSVTAIPVTLQRVIGYDSYTVIYLSWLDLLYLQAVGFYENQSRLIKWDINNYSYYKPSSITVKLIPKFPRCASKVSTVYPFKADMKIYSGPAAIAAPDGSGTSLPHALIEPNTSKFEVTETKTNQFWDDDSINLIGYIIPFNGQGCPNQWLVDPRVASCNSVFSCLAKQPDNQFLSAFRKAGYARTTISRSRPTRFVYKFTRNNLAGKPNYVSTERQRNSATSAIYAYNPTKFWEGIRFGNTTVGYSWSNRDDDLADSLKKNWIRADLETVPVWRTGSDATGDVNSTLNDYVECHVQQQMPIDGAAVFIPGIDTDSLMMMYNVQISFTCSYGGRVYDMT